MTVKLIAPLIQKMPNDIGIKLAEIFYRENQRRFFVKWHT